MCRYGTCDDRGRLVLLWQVRSASGFRIGRLPSEKRPRPDLESLSNCKMLLLVDHYILWVVTNNTKWK